MGDCLKLQVQLDWQLNTDSKTKWLSKKKKKRKLQLKIFPLTVLLYFVFKMY